MEIIVQKSFYLLVGYKITMQTGEKMWNFPQKKLKRFSGFMR